MLGTSVKNWQNILGYISFLDFYKKLIKQGLFSVC